jgi:transcriptional regulator with XRE-family HTH domain
MKTMPTPKRGPYRRMRKATSANSSKRPKASADNTINHVQRVRRMEPPISHEMSSRKRSLKALAQSKPIITSVNTAWFKSEILKAGLTQREIASAIKVDPSSVTLILSGRRRIQMGEAVILSDLLNQPLDAILANIGAVGPSVEITESVTRATVGRAKESIEVSGVLGDDLAIVDESVRGSKVVPGIEGATGLIVLKVQTSSTRFSGLDGALIYYRDVGIVDLTAIGKLSIVEVGKMKLLRVAKRGYSPGKYDLTLMDGTVTHQDVVPKSVSPVIWLKI